MHRIDTSTALPGGYFTEGDPVTPVAATVVSADWLNAVQEELVRVIQASGDTLAKADNGQLFAAILSLLPGPASELLAGLVELATGEEVAALADAGRAVTPAGLAGVLPGAATEAKAGLVELATGEEVGALTDAVRAVTPAGLAGVLPQAATTTRAGLSRLATPAEAQAGDDPAGVLTPAALRAGLNAGGAAPVYACRAWVNFNGMGTVAIRASGNVSSLTDNGTGDYTVNFVTPMPDAHYSVCATTSRTGGLFVALNDVSGDPVTTDGVRLLTTNTEVSPYDTSYVAVAVFR